MSDVKILFIVEGATAEKDLYGKLAEKMGLPVKIVSVCANIHMLYGELKKEQFQLNIADFLLTLNGVSDDDKEMIRQEKPFTYIYLMFDLDPQHYDISKDENIIRGLDEVEEMLNVFNDETDPTIGKMYINYPMIESYRDCSKFFDPDFKNRTALLDQITDYKKLVGKRGNCINRTKYSLSNFIDLAKMNVFKANYIVNKKFEGVDYPTYISTLNQEGIFNAQKNPILLDKIIQVLHSGFFFMIDYWGNKNGFYDKHLNYKEEI